MSGARPQVVVVGGSLGGLMSAVLLRSAGCAVQVLERRRQPLRGQGAGLRVRDVMADLLKGDADIDLAAICTDVHVSRYFGPDRGLVGEDPHEARFTSWDTLYLRLLGELPADAYRLGAEVVAVEPDRGRVTLADGAVIEGDLVVFADGTWSTGRALLAPAQAEPDYAGYVCWRGTAPETGFSDADRAMLDGATNVALLGPGYFGTYPIPGADGSAAPGRRLYNWVWYRNLPAGEAFRAVMTDRDGLFRPSSMPPGLARPQTVAALHAEAEARLPPFLARLVRSTPQPFVQTICDVAVPRMAFGRACLLGDAAFGGRPHLGAGTAKAAVDAQALADAVRDTADVLEALAVWEPRQLELGRDFVARNRALGDRYQFGAGEIGPTDQLRPQWSGKVG